MDHWWLRLGGGLMMLLAGALLGSAATPATAAGEAEAYFGIHVVDADSGRGVPLVELRTTYKQRYFTDSNGHVAFAEPGLMDREVWFHVDSWGYKSPQGPFGTHGVALKTTPGTIATVTIERQNIAERLYRQTGYGIYRDTLLLGRPAPIDQPLLNAQVTGCDTVQTAVYRGRMRWFWQDTDRLGFPLGSFRMTGATTALPDQLDPDRGLDFDYFTREAGGFAKEMAQALPDESRPLWLDGMMVVPDADGRERLISRYAVPNKNLTVAHAGLMIYDDDRDLFVPLKPIPNHNQSRLYPTGHPFRARARARALAEARAPAAADAPANGVDYYYFLSPFPMVRIIADFEHATDLSAYEGLTCFKPDAPDQLNRDGTGALLWTWQRGVEPVGPPEVEQLVGAGRIRPEESPYRLHDVDSGKPVGVAAGSVAWNPYLGRWTLLFGQQGGDSNVGEIWFATAPAPEGPWTRCIKIATHARAKANMDLYNPMQHPELMRENGRYVYFEGTFVNTFSGTPTPVPYYDYNQLMYRLDLADPRMKRLEE